MFYSVQCCITSDLDFFSAAMSWTLSLCSFGAERYMSSSSFISLWDSCAFLHSQDKSHHLTIIHNHKINEGFTHCFHPFISDYILLACHILRQEPTIPCELLVIHRIVTGEFFPVLWVR